MEAAKITSPFLNSHHFKFSCGLMTLLAAFMVFIASLKQKITITLTQGRLFKEQ